VRGHAWLARRVRPGVEAVLLDADAPALRQIAGHLRGRDGVTAVHVVTHGAPGRLGFASGDVDAATLAAADGDLRGIGAAITAGGGIVLWAGDVAADAGAVLVAALSAATGRAVAAATHAIGAARLGGSWSLGARVGEAPFRRSATTAYPAVLAILPGEDA